jgi:hypothetical protein
MEDDDYVLITKSYADVEDFKYNLERKKQVIPKLKIFMFIPVVVYVINPDMTDIIKTVYVMFMYADVETLLEKVKCYMVDEDKDTNYILKTEAEQEEGGLLGDVILMELYQEFKNRDGFLYMILDKE